MSRTTKTKLDQQSSLRGSNRTKKSSEEELYLQEISEELTKSVPNIRKIKRLTEILGIPYTEDPVLQIEIVLSAVNDALKEKFKNRDLEG